MCGISGYFSLRTKNQLEGYYKAHLQLRHRGNDDEGFFAVRNGNSMFYRGDDTAEVFWTQPHIRSLEKADVVLGHRRLSIIDLSPKGHQPMESHSGRYTIVYNGEIYNYIEIRKELVELGHVFRTQSDTEVLLASLEEWDVECLNRLNGMWSFAAYDSFKRRLILSRDRFGIKPLYYSQIGDILYFGSEAKFLLQFLPKVSINENRAKDYLVRNFIDHHMETMFEGVCQLLPGQYAIWDKTGLRREQYWQLPDRQISVSLSEAIEQLRELLTSAIELRLRSDVPIGSLLSGGLDSTTIVCIVDRLLKQKEAVNRFDLFSAVFIEEMYSERRYIEDTVAKTNLPIHWIYPEPELLSETLPILIRHQDFPFRSLSVFSQWEIMRAIKKTSIKVLLNGQGSDELFGGYTNHRYALITEYFRNLQIGKALSQIRFLSKDDNINVLQASKRSIWDLWSTLSPGFARNLRKNFYLTEPHNPELQSFDETNLFHNLLIRNLTMTALPEYLRYEDRNSMAFTLETRLPFLDYRLVEWAMSLPTELKINGASSKYVLRESVKSFIPPSITARKDKMGFVSPQEQWQRTVLKPLLDEVFKQDLQEPFPFLNQKQTKRLYERYQNKGEGSWSLIWRISCLYWWQQICW